MTQNYDSLCRLCIFCYKLTDNVAHDNLKIFFKFLKRFLRKCVIQYGSGFNIYNELFSCCKDCKVIIDSFCDLYNQLKYVELKLEWRLGSLLNIMKWANRVPSRVQQVKHILLREKVDVGSQTEDSQKTTSETELEKFKAFRTEVIGKCSMKLSKSYPKVLIERKLSKPEILEEVSECCPSMNTKDESEDNPNEPNDLVAHTNGLEVITKFLTSFVAIVLLAPDPSVSFNRSTEQMATHSDNLEDIEMGTITENVIGFTSTENEVLKVEQSAQGLNSDIVPEEPDKCSSKNYNCKNDKYREVARKGDCKLMITSQITDISKPISQIFSLSPKGSGIDSTENHNDFTCLEDSDILETTTKSDSIFSHHCNMCSKPFQRRISLIRHKAAEHPNSSPLRKIAYICGSCKIQFPSYVRLQIHKSCSQIHKIKRKNESSNLRRKPKRKQIYMTVKSAKPMLKVDAPFNICKMSPQEKKEKPQLTTRRYNLRENRYQKILKIGDDSDSNSIEDNFDPASISDSESELSSSSSTESETRSNSSRIILTEPKIERIDNEILPSTSSTNPNEGSSKYFSCNLDGCKKRVFTLKNEYVYHQKFHSLGKYQCKFCETVETNVIRLSVHENLEHSQDPDDKKQDDLMVNCPRCDFKTKRIWHYKEHFALAHIPEYSSHTMNRRTRANLRRKDMTHCDICKLTIKIFNKEKHFKLLHDTSNVDKVNDKDNIWKCSFEACNAYFIKTRSNAYAARCIYEHKRKPHQNLSTAIKTEPEFTCKICKKKFSHESWLQKHDKTCHKKDSSTRIKTTKLQVICPKFRCRKRFKTSAELECHQKQHGTFNCKFCSVSKNYAPSLAVHEAEVHSFRTNQEANKSEEKNSKLWNCSRCLEDFRRKPTLIKHFLKNHLNISSMGNTCSICKAEFSTQYFHAAHFKANHKIEGINESEIHRCDQCSAYFIQKSQLIFHTFSFHYKNKCPECGKVCSRPHILLEHIRNVHPKLPTFANLMFICDIGNCKRQCLTQRGLEIHQKSCRQSQQDVEKKVKCTKCEKEFATKRQFNTHNFSYHKHKLFVCQECGKNFTSRVYLKIHIDYHKGPDAWKFQCSTCGRKFADKPKLQQHMRTHTKEKPYVCQYCGGKYAHRHNWRNHVKSKHKEEYDKNDEFSEASRKKSGAKMLSRKGSKKGDCLLAGKNQK